MEAFGFRFMALVKNKTEFSHLELEKENFCAVDYG